MSEPEERPYPDVQIGQNKVIQWGVGARAKDEKITVVLVKEKAKPQNKRVLTVEVNF
jgi:hypothetical protein